MFKQEQRARIFSEMLRPQPTNLEYSKPNIYSADDMRLFHHYLVLVPPSLALDGQELWTKDLPMYSHRVCISVYSHSTRVAGPGTSHPDLFIME